MVRMSIPRRGAALTGQRRSCRPGLELLEERVTPSVTLTPLKTFPSGGTIGPIGFPGTYVVYGNPTADGQGNLYDTSYSYNNATGVVTAKVFKVAGGSGAVTSLGTFIEVTQGTVNTPNALVVDGGGNVFGTSIVGGANHDGMIFEVVKGTNTVRTLYSFKGEADGQQPGPLILSGSVLYGTTYISEGGHGTVYSIPAGGTNITTLAAFNGPGLKNPLTALTMSGSTLYGTTFGGGSTGFGGVFSVPATGGKIKVLATFGKLQSATGPVAVSNGFVYGTTFESGDHGSVFKVPANGSSPITFSKSFNISNGEVPSTGLINNGGLLIGLAQGGGPAKNGAILTVNPTTLAVTDYKNAFVSSATGTNPRGLSLDGNGNVYGAAVTGSTAHQTTVLWKLGGLVVPHLNFATQPVGGPAGKSLGTVQVSTGNIPNGATVTLTLGINPSGATLSGTRTAKVINGKATFTGLSISKPGRGYSLVATSGASSATSNSFNIVSSITSM